MALEVQIGADSSELNSELAAAEAKLKRLGDLKVKKTKLGLDTSDLDRQITSTKNKLTDLKESVKTTGSSFSAMTPKVANGGNALMQFSRIAQDAPYGIIGIGNNLTATAEAFSYLKNQTGSTGGALKALASSLMGSGGILLGISLVTTAFTLFAQSGLSIDDVVGKLTGTFNKFKQSMSEANAEASKTASEQVSSANAYVSAAKNINLSMSDRLIAVKKLQDEYPAYFGNLSKEQILNGNVTGAVNELTKALIAKAKASAYSSKIADLAVEEFKLREKESEVIGKIKKQFNEIAIAKATAASAGGQAATATNMAYGDAVDVLQSQRSSLKDVQNEIRQNALEQAKWTTEINKSTAASLKLETSTPKTASTNTPKAEKVKQPKFEFTKGFIPGGIVNPNLGLVTPDLGVDEAAIIANEKLKLALELQRKTLENFNAELGSIVTNGTVNALAGIGEAIGTAMASGGNVIDAVGKTILSSMGAMLQELGKATIAYGVGLIAVKAAIKNPYLAVAAGVAMVALGSAMSKSVSKSASSNPVTSGSGSFSTGASVSSPTSSTSSSGSSGFTSGTVVFEISGQSLIGVLSNTLDKNKRLGGAISLG